MNPQHHPFSHSAPLNPNPNPNPNPNFNSIAFPSHPQFNSPLSDLPSSLSSLSNLLRLSHSTLLSLSSIFPSQLTHSLSDSLTQCPSNPAHRVPTASLFLHWLQCPYPVEVGAVLKGLQYHKTLKSEDQLVQQNKFVQPLSDPGSELCFSLDDYVDFDCNFFYKDCPGIVSLMNDDVAKRIFTLPGVLSVECANFVTSSNVDTSGSVRRCVKILPSELWFTRFEIEGWCDYPNTYSYGVLRLLLGSKLVKECDLSIWVIVNSPRFGVVIDVPMREHILVLFRLCLKAMTREAFRSFECLYKRDTDNHGIELNLKTTFQCPVLVEVMRWLVLQLSVLYGEANAKSFAIGMLGYLLSNVSSSSSLFHVNQEMSGISAKEQSFLNINASGVSDQPTGEIQVPENDANSRENEGILSRGIYVYQVAAAIAALHERALFEEKINLLRNPRPTPAYMRKEEHTYLSKRAHEERQKRPNFRCLIEHDGLPTQNLHDEDSTNKNKTREELLAEERDYKRRRMSYRGKKLKRTKKEVMRDIIEEYMEAIKEAGGIGCFTKEADAGAVSTSRSSASRDITGVEMNPSSSKLYQISRDKRYGNSKLMHSDYNMTSTQLVDTSSRRYEQHGRNTYDSGKHVRGRTTTPEDRHESDYYSRSPSRDTSRGSSRERRSHRRDHGVGEADWDKHFRSKHDSSNSSRHHDRASIYSSRSLDLSSQRKEKRKLESSDRHQRKTSDNNRSYSVTRDGFEDRYDPSESYDDYEYRSSGSRYARPD